jgi:2-keto-myo-inositol isomerase
MEKKIKFAINHMVCPSFSPEKLVEGCQAIGVDAIEFRNDIKESILTVDQAQKAGDIAKAGNIKVLSINALYPFNIWNDERAEQTKKMAELCAAAGAQGLVMCPFNEAGYDVTEEQRKDDLEKALSAIKPILSSFGVKGFVEVLGFPISSLRYKKIAVDVIKKMGEEKQFQLVHDTFHHKGAGEAEIFAANTGIVHISGVEDTSVTFETMLDGHRILIGPKDRLDNVSQIRDLHAAGYEGYFSFEPFSEPVWNLPDPIKSAKESIDYILQNI